MPESAGPDRFNGGAPQKLSLWQRWLVGLPRFKQRGEKAPFLDRVKGAILKPEDPDAPPRPSPKGAYELSGEELEIEAKGLNEKERLIGLFAAPLASAIGFIVVHILVINDPPAHLSNGAVDKLYVNPNDYYDLFLVLVVLSMAMLATAFLRKRLYLGMVTALYGLTIFNMHYWGFGVPFVMVGAWYLVRAYRLNKNLKASLAGGPAPGVRPANKRYTPPVVAPKPLPPAKSKRTRRAG